MYTSRMLSSAVQVQALILDELNTDSSKFIAEETSEELQKNSILLQEVTKVVNAARAASDELSERQICEAIDRGDFKGGRKCPTWVLDPIDGTKGFMRMEQFCIALGLLVDGKVVLGVLGCPNLPYGDADQIGCIFYAERGQGAFCVGDSLKTEPTPIRVSSVADLPGCRFMESVESAHSSFALSAKIAATLGVKEPPIRMDSQCKYGALGRGDGQIYLRFPRAGYEENIWDHAAGTVVIEEAGGKVTDGTGQPLDFSIGRKLNNKGGIIATNGIVHTPVINAVVKSLGL